MTNRTVAIVGASVMAKSNLRLVPPIIENGTVAERSRVDGSTTDKTEELDLEDQNSDAAIDADEEAIAEAAQ